MHRRSRRTSRRPLRRAATHESRSQVDVSTTPQPQIPALRAGTVIAGRYRVIAPGEWAGTYSAADTALLDRSTLLVITSDSVDLPPKSPSIVPLTDRVASAVGTVWVYHVGAPTAAWPGLEAPKSVDGRSKAVALSELARATDGTPWTTHEELCFVAQGLIQWVPVVGHVPASEQLEVVLASLKVTVPSSDPERVAEALSLAPTTERVPVHQEHPNSRQSTYAATNALSRRKAIFESVGLGVWIVIVAGVCVSLIAPPTHQKQSSISSETSTDKLQPVEAVMEDDLGGPMTPVVGVEHEVLDIERDARGRVERVRLVETDYRNAESLSAGYESHEYWVTYVHGPTGVERACLFDHEGQVEDESGIHCLARNTYTSDEDRVIPTRRDGQRLSVQRGVVGASWVVVGSLWTDALIMDADGNDLICDDNCLPTPWWILLVDK